MSEWNLAQQMNCVNKKKQENEWNRKLEPHKYDGGVEINKKNPKNF